MIDPELKYCPECDDEYRAEIVRCAACGVELITGLEKIAQQKEQQERLEKRSTELSPDDDLVVIRRGPLPDMRHLRELLSGENIATLLAGDEKSCGKGCCPSVYDLLVRREDCLEALHILEEEHRRTTGLADFDYSAADVVFNPAAGAACCPACGHSFPTSETTCPDCGLSIG
jgi:hypothetical protein